MTTFLDHLMHAGYTEEQAKHLPLETTMDLFAKARKNKTTVAICGASGTGKSTCTKLATQDLLSRGHGGWHTQHMETSMAIVKDVERIHGITLDTDASIQSHRHLLTQRSEGLRAVNKNAVLYNALNKVEVGADVLFFGGWSIHDPDRLAIDMLLELCPESFFVVVVTASEEMRMANLQERYDRVVNDSIDPQRLALAASIPEIPGRTFIVSNDVPKDYEAFQLKLQPAIRAITARTEKFKQEGVDGTNYFPMMPLSQLSATPTGTA